MSKTPSPMKPPSRPPSVRKRSSGSPINSKDLKAVGAVMEPATQKTQKGGGSTLYKSEKDEPEVMSKRQRTPSPPPMKMGGEVKKTGVYKLHKGEIVVPANRVASVNKSLMKDNKKPLKK